MIRPSAGDRLSPMVDPLNSTLSFFLVFVEVPPVVVCGGVPLACNGEYRNWRIIGNILASFLVPVNTNKEKLLLTPSFEKKNPWTSPIA